MCPKPMGPDTKGMTMSQLTTESQFEVTADPTATNLAEKLQSAKSAATHKYVRVSEASRVRQLVAGFLIGAGVAALTLPTLGQWAAGVADRISARSYAAQVAEYGQPSPLFAPMIEKLNAQEAAEASAVTQEQPTQVVSGESK
jgi:hypothetical protein